MKPVANLSTLWPELSYFDRFDAAAEAGFEAVDILAPYDVAVPETIAALTRHGLQFVRLSAPPPNYTGGTRGFAADPDATQRFQYDMRRVFRYAKALKAQFVQILPGPVEGDTSIATLITNLRSVAQDTPQGQSLLLGALPFADGRFDYAASVEVIEAVNAPNLRLIFSTGLAQVMVKTLARAYLTLGATVGYVQLTDPPGKGTFEDQAGDMPALFETLRGSGYDGFISGSYAPNGPTENTLTAWRDLIR